MTATSLVLRLTQVYCTSKLDIAFTERFLTCFFTVRDAQSLNFFQFQRTNGWRHGAHFQLERIYFIFIYRGTQSEISYRTDMRWPLIASWQRLCATERVQFKVTKSSVKSQENSHTASHFDIEPSRFLMHIICSI